MIEIKPIPFNIDALEPHISKDTMDTHYNKHYRGYVNNLNKLIDNTVYEQSKLAEIIEMSSGPIFNNAAQIFNHEFYFNGLTDKSAPFEGALKNEIEWTWGSVDKFKTAFNKTAKSFFGSGWCWLVYNSDTGALSITTTENAGTPIDPLIPLMVCDLWEHAYYLDHKNDRGKYLEAFWNVVNWETADKEFSKAQ